MKAANDNVVRSSTTGRPLEIGQMIRDGKAAVETRRKEEARAMKIEVARIDRRAAQGANWDGKPANDNTTPAIKWLLAGQRNEMLKPLLAYVRLDREANSGAMLTGEAYTPADMLQVDQATWLDPATGDLKYKGERRLRGIEFSGREHAGKSTVDPMQVKKAPAAVPKPWSGDAAVIARIDAGPQLARIRAALGPLLMPFERLVLEGKKLEQVGWNCFATNERAAMSVGGAILMMGLGVVAEELEALKVKRRAA